MARHYTRITVYIAREFVFSFLVAFLFFFFIFFINQMLLLAEEILTKRVPPLDVLLLVVYSLPSIVALSVPFGSLVGALMTVGRFSSDNEIIAFQASGVPHRRLFIPLIGLGLSFSLFSFVMNDYFLPLGTINFGRLYRELIFSNPELELESYTVKNYQDSIIVTGAVRGREIQDILILDENERGERRIIAADSARLTQPGGDAGVLSLDLTNVLTQTLAPDAVGDYDYSTSETMQYNVLLKDITFNIRNPGPREMSSVDVWAVIQDKRKTLLARQSDQMRLVENLKLRLAQEYLFGSAEVYSGQTTVGRHTQDLNSAFAQYQQELLRPIVDRTLQNYELEFHKKFSIPFACLTFVIFAFPVGLMTRRAGRAVGFGIGLLVSTLYWSMLIAGQTLGINNPTLSPALAMWLPNVIILLLGGSALLLRIRR